MEQLIYVFVQIVYIFLFILQLMMLLRVICSIFIMDDENNFLNFLYCATEPIIYPVRRLFQKFGAFEDFVLDMPFMATMFLIVLVQSILPTVMI